MFRTTQNKGFHMKFKNGLTISVQFGTGSYCSRRDMNASFQSERQMHTVESPDAEIAIWDKDNDKWFNFGDDEVKPYCDTDEVASWIILTTAATSLEDLRTRALNCGMIKE